MDKSEKKAVLNVRMTQEFKEDLEAYADSIGLDMSSCIRMTMLEKMKEKK